MQGGRNVTRAYHVVAVETSLGPSRRGRIKSYIALAASPTHCTGYKNRVVRRTIPQLLPPSVPHIPPSIMSTSRVALVTGGAQGMGEAIALRLASEGIDVAIFDIKGKETQLASVVKQIEAKGRKALWIVGDVAKEEDVKGAVDKTVSTLGSLDIVRYRVPVWSSF